MSKTVSITATKRDALGSANARRIRRAGFVPAVVYGHGNVAASITVSPADAEKVTAHSGLVEIVCEGGEKKLAVVKDIQRDPLKDFFLHLDFQEVKMDEVITSTVPVIHEGEPIGAKEGGQLEQVMMEIEVKSLPTDMPEHILVDVTALELNHQLHVKDLVYPQGVTPAVSGDLIVFTCKAPHAAAEPAAEEAAPAEGEAAAEAAPAAEAKK